MFETGIGNFKRFAISIEVCFPIDGKGRIYTACNYCKMYQHGRCFLTGNKSIDSEIYVAHGCPIAEMGVEKNERV